MRPGEHWAGVYLKLDMLPYLKTLRNDTNELKLKQEGESTAPHFKKKDTISGFRSAIMAVYRATTLPRNIAKRARFYFARPLIRVSHGPP